MRPREVCGRQAADRMSVRAVGMPYVLRSRKLNYFDLARQSSRLLCAGNLELHIQLRWAFGILVDCK